jgi:hypothetical protein
MSGQNIIRRGFNLLASVRLAIPLLVLIAAASIAGSLIPQGRNVRLAEEVPSWVQQFNAYFQLTDIFHSWWYITLLGLLGGCLLAITLKRLPTVWRQQGKGAGAGILLAHLGILMILGGMMYGGFSGFRYYAHLIEGEVTVLPPLPFVIKLDRFDLRYFDPDTFRHWGPNVRLPEKQESNFTLLHHGKPFLQAKAAPGRPVVARGVTILPSEKDVGWAFTLVIHAPNGHEKVIPIRPWNPPLITLGFGNTTRILAHRLSYDESAPQGADGSQHPTTTEIIQLSPDGTTRSLGFAQEGTPLDYYSWKFSVERIRPYTGLHVYRRPEKPFLIGGLATLLVGLTWFFLRPGRLATGFLRRKGSGEQTGQAGAPGETPPEPPRPGQEFEADVVQHWRD